MNAQDINKLFEDFTRLKVLVIGDVMVDSYMWGTVNRISPEAPVPIVSVTKRENRLGGAANVGLNVKALGAVPVLCSVIGEDENGTLFHQMLQSQNLSADGIIRSRDRITSTKTRVIGNKQQMVRVDEEGTDLLSTTDAQRLINRVKELIPKEKPDVIIFEDYDKGVITAEVIREVIKLAKEAGIPTAADPKRNNFNAYQGITLFKPNLKELKEGLNLIFDEVKPETLQLANEKLREILAMETTLITLSEKGIFVSHRDHEAIIPAHIRDIADVSGAGDTVISVASLCLALKVSPQWTARIANLAGGIVCEEAGVVPIQNSVLKEEILQALLKNPNG